MSEKREISKATGIMGVATSLSRVAGLVRDMVVATLFGAGNVTDAFFTAFTLPNLLRRFFAEGSLTAAFIPTFADIFHKKGRDEAMRVARITFTLLFLIVGGVTVAGIIFSPFLVKLVGAGFEAVEGKLELTDYLNRLMFPYIFFVSLLALITGVLNVLGHYFLPAVSPLVLNIAMIVCALVLGPHFDVPITALAVGVLAGGAGQLLLQLPALRAHGVSFRPDFHFRDPSVVRIARLMVPGIVGVAIYQINIAVSRLLASYLPEGSISYLYYGQRLFEFPQGIFIVSLAQAVLPAMSRQVAAGDRDGMKESLRFALSLMLLVTVPAAAGLMVSAEAIFSLFFMRGAFDYEQVRQSAFALAAYAPGLLFVGVSRVVVPTFYALKNTRTPVWISFWTLVVHVGLGLLLRGPLAHVGLAWALTLSSVFNAAFLLYALRRQVGNLGLARLGWTLARIIPVTALMSLVVWQVLRLVEWGARGETILKGGVLGAAIFAGIAVYAGGCLAMRITEAAEVYALIRRKLLKKMG